MKKNILMLIVGLLVGFGIMFGTYYFFFRNDNKVLECPKCDNQDLSLNNRNIDIARGSYNDSPYRIVLKSDGSVYLSIDESFIDDDVYQNDEKYKELLNKSKNNSSMINIDVKNVVYVDYLHDNGQTGFDYFVLRDINDNWYYFNSNDFNIHNAGKGFIAAAIGDEKNVDYWWTYPVLLRSDGSFLDLEDN